MMERNGVYLDIGKVPGVGESMDEAFRCQVGTGRDHEEIRPCILAGPSSDDAEVLDEKCPVALPPGLRAGGRFVIRNRGADNSTIAAIGFDGCPPLDVVVA